MNRRSFLKMLGAIAAVVVSPGLVKAAPAQQVIPKPRWRPYQMEMMMQLHREGMVSSTLLLEFCDIDYDAEVRKIREEQSRY